MWVTISNSDMHTHTNSHKNVLCHQLTAPLYNLYTYQRSTRADVQLSMSHKHLLTPISENKNSMLYHSLLTHHLPQFDD